MSMINTSIPANAEAVTPSDTAGTFSQALYIGGSGDVKVRTEAGDVVTFSNCPTGLIIPIRVNLVYSTGTTATNIVRMY